jgi:hypothetical protein
MDDKVFYYKTLPPLPANRWVPATIRLRDFGVTGTQKMLGMIFQNGKNGPAHAYYVAVGR